MVDVKILQQEGYNFLWVDKRLWMWDIPEEDKLQKQIADQAYGDVLVAGYGLGLVQKYLFENPKVKSVLTIELLPEVVNENNKIFNKLYGEVIFEDFSNFKSTKKYDCVIGDIWVEISKDSLKDYIKFKERAKSLIKENGRIFGWGQDYYEYLLGEKNGIS